MPERSTTANRQRPWITWALVGLVVVVLAVSFGIARTHAPATEFGGADAQAVEALEEQGVEPWFRPMFAPGSGEVESGIFAAQAALGGAVLGWAIGRLQSRATIRRLEAGRATARGSAEDH